MFVLTRIVVKAVLWKIHGFCEKSFGCSAKDVCEYKGDTFYTSCHAFHSCYSHIFFKGSLYNCEKFTLNGHHYLALPEHSPIKTIPVNIYLFKVNNRNTRKRREICSELTIKTPKRCQ